MRALLVAVFIASCRPPAPTEPFTLRMAVWGPLEPVSPKFESSGWSTFANAVVYEPLLRIGQQGEIVPVLAARAELTSQGSLRIWLRDGPRFSDGSPVTPDDVVKSLAANALQATLAGDHIDVTCEQRGVPVELIVSWASIYRDAGPQPLGTGAFAVEEQDSTHILLTRVVPAAGVIGKVRLDSYATPQDAFARTLKGDADMLPDVLPRWVEFFEGVPRLRILRGPGPTVNMMAFNTARLTRAERVSLAAALSNDELRSVAFGEDCVPPAHRPEIEPVPAGRALDIVALPMFDRLAFATRRALGDRGGNVRFLETRDLVGILGKGDYDLASFRPRIWPPSMAALIWHSGSAGNMLHYSSPAVDAALDARDWAAAQRALEADPPGAVVCASPTTIVLDSRIKTTLGPYFKESLPRWEVSQ